jgi:hypothetical protein
MKCSGSRLKEAGIIQLSRARERPLLKLRESWE